jgi:transcriptional regulator with XRE-family HTH domain
MIVSKVAPDNPIYKWRVKNSVTRRALEDLIQIPYTDIYSWECGKTIPSDNSIKKLSEIGIDIEELKIYIERERERRVNKKIENLDILKENPILKWRLKTGMKSRQKLADRLGVSRQTLLNWETGAFLPQEKYIYALANEMGRAALDLYQELSSWKEDLE